MNYDKEIAGAVTSLILIYLFYPNYVKGVPLFGINSPELWVIIPIFIGLVVYFVWAKRDTLTEKFMKLDKSKLELEEPLKCLDKFENSPERMIIRGDFHISDYVRFENEWVYLINQAGVPMYLTLNGVKDQNLNPQLVSRTGLKEMGFENVKDFKRTGKSRSLYDLLSLTSSPDELRKVGELLD